VLAPESFEFWESRPSRLHDRIRFTREENGWKQEFLAP
jgi:pyridoxamine 5'-phosphate oxidase